ncbi:MAG: AAA family ATPase, partial [Armatimonadetes bacterium]|nr:AAA family ATPase [Armatimonadota bacterium]
ASIEFDRQLDARGLANYLANNPDIRGIGPAKARIIAEKFGSDFEHSLINEPENIADAAKVPLAVIESLRDHWLETSSVNSAMTALSAYGLTHHQVTRLVKKLGNNAVGIIERDPYIIVGEIDGFGFKRIDKIARQVGIAKDNLNRIRAGIVFCVEDALDQGDCWVEYEDLLDRANKLLVMDSLDSRERIEQHLDNLIDEKVLTCYSADCRFLVAMPSIRHMEKDLARVFADGMKLNPHFSEMDTIEREVIGIAPKLNPKQLAAVLTSVGHSVSLISGGAGSGKTFTVDALTRLCESRGLRVVLCAPTGKAAKRMEESTGRPASTIHRLLGFDGKTYFRNSENPISADTVVVDECFDYKQPILTERGWDYIGRVVNRHKEIRVWSRDPESGLLQLKPIIRWLKHPAPDTLLKITVGRSQSMRNARVIRCTPDHKILTPYGYRRASDLRTGEEIIVRGHQFTPEQRSILIGSLLGDAGINRGSARTSPQVVFVHGEKQSDYLEFKRQAFGIMAGKVRAGKSGYSDDNVLCLSLAINDETYDISKEMILNGKHPSGRRRWSPTNRFLEMVDELALAIWYFDNGSSGERTLKGGRKRYYATLHTERFNEADLYRIAEFLNTRFGLSPSVRNDSRGHWILRFNKKETEKLFNIIRPYTPACMSRKIDAEGRYSYRPVLQPDTCIARVQEIEDCKPSQAHVYDIEVADFHNYVAGNVIVSNCSMIDVPLAWRLFDAIDLSRTAVVLVGDHCQLPPVGPGNILRDLIESRVLPTTILDDVIRQAGVLKENSIAILRGEVRKTSTVEDGRRGPWYVADQHTEAERVQRFILSLYEHTLRVKLGFDILRDVQLLTPTHKGPLGTAELNTLLQRLIQRKLWNYDVPPVQPGKRPKLLINDKVIQTRNNYDLDVMNGSMGFVRDVGADGSLTVEFDNRIIHVEAGSPNRDEIQLAYALTIHRCQGSEFPCSIVITHKSHSFQHHRNLLYTGVTRAKETAIIVGDRWGIANCAKRVQVDARKTFLSLILPNLSASGGRI